MSHEHKNYNDAVLFFSLWALLSTTWKIWSSHIAMLLGRLRKLDRFRMLWRQFKETVEQRKFSAGNVNDRASIGKKKIFAWQKQQQLWQFYKATPLLGDFQTLPILVSCNLHIGDIPRNRTSPPNDCFS